MGRERRTADRFKVSLPARWEGVLDRHEGIVTDISTNGCFLLSAGSVTKGELVRVEIQLPTEGWIYIWGEVVYPQEEIGFAVRFTGSGEQEMKMLQLLIDYVREQTASE
ncbi:MAG TPA: PilZ domain-containing protein [Pyrinomonadaceae bacterium]|nr:PilZ domain-containing protein [Pyrinomonadaceae bacterium]